MATEKQEHQLRELAELLDESARIMYGRKMGFILLVAPFNNEGSGADYISNGQREDCIKWMKETIERFEANEIIPAGGGHA